MSEVKKETTVKEFKENQAKDKSWKKEPWIGEDGFEYRKQRVKNEDGTFSFITVRIGEKPIAPPKEGI